jgi:hypothetical protein
MKTKGEKARKRANKAERTKERTRGERALSKEITAEVTTLQATTIPALKVSSLPRESLTPSPAQNLKAPGPDLSLGPGPADFLPGLADPDQDPRKGLKLDEEPEPRRGRNAHDDDEHLNIIMIKNLTAITASHLKRDAKEDTKKPMLSRLAPKQQNSLIRSQPNTGTTLTLR